MFMKRLACKFSVKWIVHEADIQNRFLEKYTPSTIRENQLKLSNFLTRYRTIVFFKEEKNLSGFLYKKKLPASKAKCPESVLEQFRSFCERLR